MRDIVRNVSHSSVNLADLKQCDYWEGEIKKTRATAQVDEWNRNYDDRKRAVSLSTVKLDEAAQILIITHQICLSL